MKPDRLPLTGESLRTHAKILAKKAKAEGPVTVHAIQLHSTVLLADYAAVLRQIVALALRKPEFAKLIHTDPVLQDLYTAVFNTELDMEVPEHLRIAKVAYAQQPLSGPPPDPQAPAA